MRYFLAVCCWALPLWAEQPVATYTRFCATCGIRGADTILSQSGQFVVHGSTTATFPPPGRPREAAPLVFLEPQLVAVTAERTKRAFLEELVAADSFQDKIHIVLLPAARPEQPIGVVSHVHPDGFQYQVGLPVYLEGGRLVKGIVQAIVQEYANRGGRRNADLPSWLVEGMTRQILSSVVPAPVLNRQPVTIERLGYDRLRLTRAYFQTNTPLTIQELSFSDLAGLGPEGQVRYENSAHLLVFELLRLRHGPALLGAFMQSLPHTLNWQTAFYHTWRQYFRTPLDLEKWWSLACLEVRNRQAHETWTTAASLERLESILRTPMEFRVNTNAIPEQRDATLQEILQSTDYRVHRDILSEKLQQIFFISASLSPEVAPLAAAYQQAIESYLQKRSQNDVQPSLRSDPAQRLQVLVKSTLRTLDELAQAGGELRAGRKPRVLQKTRPAAGRQVLVNRENSQN